VKLLLDTHTALWWTAAGSPLGDDAIALIEDPENAVLLSAVVIWEVSIKRALGKLDASTVFVDDLLAGGAQPLHVTLAHAARVEHLPDHHRDPFDRLLVAQALIEDATLVTKDTALAAYGVDVAW